MKKRVFYVINLDRGRIWILATLLVSTLLFSFATGFRVGGSQSPALSGGPARQSQQMELAELGATTGSPGDSTEELSGTSNALDSDEAGDLDERDALDDANHGESPFEKNRGPNQQQQEYQQRQSARQDGTYSLSNPALSVTDSSSEPAPRRVSANDNRKSKSKSKATTQKKKNLTTKRKTKVAKKSKSSAQKKGTNSANNKKNQKKVAKNKTKKQVAQKQSSKQKSKAKSTRTPASGDNPRSALLDTESGSLRMSNISKTKPAVTGSTGASSANAKTAAKTAAHKTYSLQLGAFSSQAASGRMAATLKKQGFHPYIVQSRGKYLVRVGKSDTAKGLWKLETGLRKKKYAPMRISYKSP